MRHYRIHIAIDVKAKDRDQAEHRAGVIYSDIEAARRRWIIEFLAGGIEERIPIRRPSP